MYIHSDTYQTGYYKYKLSSINLFRSLYCPSVCHMAVLMFVLNKQREVFCIWSSDVYNGHPIALSSLNLSNSKLELRLAHSDSLFVCSHQLKLKNFIVKSFDCKMFKRQRNKCEIINYFYYSSSSLHEF